MYTNYQDIRNCVCKQKGFVGNSATGRIENDGTYKVFSYGTLILKIRNNRVVMFDNRGYSVTTSRLQNIIAETFGYPTKRNGKIYNN